MDFEVLYRLRLIRNAVNLSTNEIWKIYKEKSGVDELKITLKYEMYHNDITLHPKYLEEYTYYKSINVGSERFSTYFKNKLKVFELIERIDSHKKFFKLAMLHHRGYNVSDDLEELDDLNEQHRITDLIKDILRFSHYLPNDLIEELDTIMIKAIEYEQLGLQLKVNKVEEATFVNLRKIFRNYLLSESISSDQKSQMRKIINEIHVFVKIEFASIRYIEDHQPTSSENNNLKRTHSTSPNNALKKIKLNRAVAVPITSSCIAPEIKEEEEDEDL